MLVGNFCCVRHNVCQDHVLRRITKSDISNKCAALFVQTCLPQRLIRECLNQCCKFKENIVLYLASRRGEGQVCRVYQYIQMMSAFLYH